jgi:hypothetical protein
MRKVIGTGIWNPRCMPVSFILIIVLFVVITIVHQEKQYDIYS